MDATHFGRAFARRSAEGRDAEVWHWSRGKGSKGPPVIDLELDVGLDRVRVLDRRFKIGSGERDGTVSGETYIGAVFDDAEEGIDERAIRVVA